jgi:hypothetical protein
MAIATGGQLGSGFNQELSNASNCTSSDDSMGRKLSLGRLVDELDEWENSD